jgi:hypothetical protein
MPAIYHEGSWLGNATDPEVLVKDTVGWTGKNRAYSQTNNAVVAHIENGITYDVSWTGSATVTLKKNSASGATITSGSTSPLSFTADADYELYFGSSAAVTNIMVKDSRITDPTYEPYHESVEEEIEQIYADNGVLGAKNLLEVTANTETRSATTFTINKDDKGNVLNVNVNGTPSSDIYFRINSKFSEVGRYILNGILDGSNTFRMQAYIYASSDNTFKRSYTDTGSGTEVVIDNGEYANFEIIVTQSGGAVNNKKVYPMLRLASDPDDTYQPYAMTNRELTEKVNTANSAIDNLLSLGQAIYSKKFDLPANGSISISQSQSWGYQPFLLFGQRNILMTFWFTADGKTSINSKVISQDGESNAPTITYSGTPNRATITSNINAPITFICISYTPFTVS